jgi:hypothetical protein
MSFSYGAPVPEEPTKNFCPSGSVMSLALAVVESVLRLIAFDGELGARRD